MSRPLASRVLAKVRPAARMLQIKMLRRQQSRLPEVPLTIRSGSRLHRFKVEVAGTGHQQWLGMMLRTSIRADGGMIFPFARPQSVTFWMKDTLIPLDMIFILEGGSIARIVTAAPQAEMPISSSDAVIAVLEIAGGRAAELGIGLGDTVTWPSPACARP